MIKRTWQLKLFGGFQLVAPNGATFVTKAKRVKLLLAYLALCPTASSNRKTLAAAIFEDEDLAPDSNFALLLTRLKKALANLDSQPLLLATRDEVGLVLANVDIDLQRFSSLARAASVELNLLKRSTLLARALQDADGPLLPETRLPLLVPLIEQAETRVLSAVSQLSELPLAKHHQDLILDRLHRFEDVARYDPLQMEHVLRVYGNLGIKEKVIKVYTDYEVWLQEEYGEQPRKELLRLFNELSEGSDPGRQRLVSCPERPAFTVGRDEEIAAAIAHATTSNGSRVMTLNGLSGIGKSHILREVFWRIEAQKSVAQFDLGFIPSESVLVELAKGAPDVLILDEASRVHAGLIDRILGENPGLRVLAASHERLGLSSEATLLIQPLACCLYEDSAIELVERYLAETSESADLADSSRGMKLELARLCEGIPLALEIAAKLARSIGLETTIQSLRRDAASLSYHKYDRDDHSSLGRAIERSYLNLSIDVARIVLSIAACGSRMPRDLAVFASGARLEDLEEAVLSGLVTLEADGFVRMSEITSTCVLAVGGELAERHLIEFARQTGVWFEAQAAVSPIDTRLAPAMLVGIAAMKRLSNHELLPEAVSLFLAMGSWFGLFRLSNEDLTTIAEIALASADQSSKSWGDAILTLGIVYFYSGDRIRMASLLEGAIGRPGFDDLEVRVQSNLLTQAGLAYRRLDKWVEAEALYRRSIALAESAKLREQLTFAYYNLAVMLEFLERLEEAQLAFEVAASNFGMGTDGRLQSLVRCGLGRLLYRLGQDVDAAQFVLVSAVYDAMERNEKRGAAEILQNLGLVYFDQGHFRKAAYVEALGTSMLLEYGYDDQFRRLSKSSLVTLSASLQEMGFNALALSVRILVDRLGEFDLYEPNKRLFEKITSKTYRSPEGAHYDVASEHEVKVLLDRCLTHLKTHAFSEAEGQELTALIHAYGA